MYLRARVWVLVLLALNCAAYAAMADLGGWRRKTSGTRRF